MNTGNRKREYVCKNDMETKSRWHKNDCVPNEQRNIINLDSSDILKVTRISAFTTIG